MWDGQKVGGTWRGWFEADCVGFAVVAENGRPNIRVRAFEPDGPVGTSSRGMGLAVCREERLLYGRRITSARFSNYISHQFLPPPKRPSQQFAGRMPSLVPLQD